MASGEQSHVKYERLSIQKEAGKETSGLIYQSIYHQWGNLYQCGQTTAANFDENSLSSKYQ